MAKLDCYGKYEDTNTKHLQVIYLSEVIHLTPKEISVYVDYAVSTIKNYIRKFADRLKEAKQLFKKVLNHIAGNDYDIFLNGYEKITKPCAYVIKIYDDCGFYKWLKVGKAKNLEQRMKGIARHGYKDTNISQIEVMHVFECETEDDALTMENVLRKFYKAKANSIFIPNDRFENIEFNKEEIENNSIIQSQYSLCKETF